MKHTHFFEYALQSLCYISDQILKRGQILFYQWLNPLTSASHYLLDITDKSSFDKAMSYIKELTETNPVSLFHHSCTTTPTTTAIFQFLQVV